MNNKIEQFVTNAGLPHRVDNDAVVNEITEQQDFDILIEYLFGVNRYYAKRAADLIEQISITHPHYLEMHQENLLRLLETDSMKELNWHLIRLIPRLSWTKQQETALFVCLSGWLLNQNESRMFRERTMAVLMQIIKRNPGFRRAYQLLRLKLNSETSSYLKNRVN
jgi:hypothetical protein